MLAWLHISEPAWAQTNPHPRRLVTIWRSSDPRLEGVLTAVAAIERTRSGNILVLDQQAASLFVLDSLGRLQRTIGARGSGPGEFQQPAMMGRHGDSIWIADAALRRVSVYTALGRLVRTQSVARDGLAHLLPDGDLLVLPPTPVGVGGADGRLIIERVNARDSTTTAILSAARQSRVLDLVVGSGRRLSLQPFDDTPIFAIGRDGSGVIHVERSVPQGHGSQVRIRKLDARGNTLFDLALQYEPQPMPDALVDSAVQRILESVQRRIRDVPEASLRRTIRTALYVPEFSPSITAVLAAQDGTTWLRREESVSGDVRWTIVDRRGTATADVMAPRNALLHWTDGRSVLGTVPDGDGTPRVVRFRLR